MVTARASGHNRGSIAAAEAERSDARLPRRAAAALYIVLGVPESAAIGRIERERPGGHAQSRARGVRAAAVDDGFFLLQPPRRIGSRTRPMYRTPAAVAPDDTA